MHAPNNPYRRQITANVRVEQGITWLLRFATYAIVLAASFIFLTIFFKGAPTVFSTSFPFVNIEFLTQQPETLHVIEQEGQKTVSIGDREFRVYEQEHDISKARVTNYVYAAGGIFPNIVGTVLLVVGSMSIALILGIFSAIYLSEYSRQGTFIRIVRLAILNLAGVPSIVFGLFGFGMFVLAFNWGVSLLAGWFTLAFMVLPVIITASEESLRAVPKGFREGSLALGATQWQTIRQNVLPYALPGILTSSILGIARVAGETAPIMFTCAFVMRDEMPWQVKHFFDFFFQGVMALPYHIYVVSSKIPQNEYTEKVQYGTTFIFLFIVIGIALMSVLLRIKMRNRYKW
jgi:phosphate transport system permease protein